MKVKIFIFILLNIFFIFLISGNINAECEEDGCTDLCNATDQDCMEAVDHPVGYGFCWHMKMKCLSKCKPCKPPKPPKPEPQSPSPDPLPVDPPAKDLLSRETIVFVYEHNNFTGRCVELNSSVPDLRKLNFNDVATSLKIMGTQGQYEVTLFKDINYQGEAISFKSPSELKDFREIYIEKEINIQEDSGDPDGYGAKKGGVGGRKPHNSRKVRYNINDIVSSIRIKKID